MRGRFAGLRTGIAGLLATLMAGTAVVAAPSEQAWEPSVGGWASGPLAFVDAVQFEAGPAGGLDRRGDLLVATSWSSFSLYDVSEPLDPVLLSITPLGVHAINERPQLGHGWLAVNDDIGGTLTIYDISDPSAPAEIARIDSPGSDHQWTCVADCTHLYSNTGTIVSMADPRDPEIVGSWHASLPEAPRATHGIAEVAPGLVMTGTLPVHLLDARDDATAPVLLATEEVPTTSANAPYVLLGPPPESFAADLAWPLDGSGDHALVSLETPFSGECTAESGEVLALDMGQVEDGTMPVVGRYQITEPGLPSEGGAVVNVVGCSPYVLSPHPGYETSGWVATGFMENGTRLLRVDEDGSLEEVGGFIGHGGAAAAPLWIDEETLYVLDFVRGIDILQVVD